MRKMKTMGDGNMSQNKQSVVRWRMAAMEISAEPDLHSYLHSCKCGLLWEHGDVAYRRQ